MKINLSLNQRFSLLLMTFVGMTAIVFYMLVIAKNEPIIFGTQELKGNSYQKPLVKIMKGLSQHRKYAQRALYGDKVSAAKLVEIQTELSSAFDSLQKVDLEHGEALQFTDQGLLSRKREHYRASTLLKEWNELKAKVTTLKPAESNDLHAHLIGDVRTMITHAGDTSNLILDPDLDSYYLMDITLLALPQSQDRIQNAIIELEPIIRRGFISNDEKIKASVFASMMNEADIARINGDFQTILNEDANFYGVQATLEPRLTAGNQNFVNSYKAFVDLITDLSNGKIATPDKFVQVSNTALLASFDYWDVAVTELDGLLQTRVNTMQNSKTQAAVGSLICLILSLFVAYAFSRYLVKNMHGIVDVLSKSSNEVSGASSNSAASATELSEASAEQAASLQETMATIEQISAMVTQNAESASKTKQAVDANQKVSENGSKSVEEMMLAIAEIKDTNEKILLQMESSNKEFGEIVKIISEIGQKTNVINEIVFQTKLLSFNASVEAARAGEHGKGFAVVAEEVGNLAQMSGNAAKEITDMLANSIKKVNSIVENTKTRVDKLVDIGRDKILMGQSTAQKCREALEKVTENAQSVAQMINEITKASQEQAQGIQEITKAFSQLDQVTQQNSAVALQSSTQAERLNAESASLTEAVKKLVLFVDGKKKQLDEEYHNLNSASSDSKKVVPLKRNINVNKNVQAKHTLNKTAVGSGVIPSSNDPNFEEF